MTDIWLQVVGLEKKASHKLFNTYLCCLENISGNWCFNLVEWQTSDWTKLRPKLNQHWLDEKEEVGWLRDLE